MRDRDQVDDADQGARLEDSAAALRDDPVDHRRAEVVERRQRAFTQRVPVVPVDPLGEVDVAPGLGDVAEQLVLPHPLAVLDALDDVPVPVRAAGAGDDTDVLGAFGMNGSARDRVDGVPSGAETSTPKWSALLPLRADARIAEEPAHGVLLVERLHGPAVAH